jgi:hypothetical protein
MLEKIAELFTLKSAAITADLARVSDEQNLSKLKSDVERATDALIAPHLSQVDFAIRAAAVRMAEFYQIFYMLENDMRQFVAGVMVETYDKDWWTKHVPEPVRNYAKTNKDRESK